MARQNELKKLIKEQRRQLQKLKEQQAKFGLHTPPYVLTEIEDREEEIEKLKTQLSSIENSNSSVAEKKSGKSEKTQTRILLLFYAGILLFIVILASTVYILKPEATITTDTRLVVNIHNKRGG